DAVPIEVHIELTARDDKGLKNAHRVNHFWGKNNVVPSHVSRVIPKEIPTIEFPKRLKKAQELSGGQKVDALKTLAVWALQRGLTKQFHTVMAELKSTKSDDPAVSAMVSAYLKVQADMAQTPTPDPALKELLSDLKSKEYVEIQSDQGHYS